MLKKLGKKLRKAAKAVVPVGAAILAAKAMGGRKKKPLTPKYFGMDSGTTGDANIAENIANFDQGMTRIADAGGVANLKKGGRVGCGKAKRGFGRALRKK